MANNRLQSCLASCWLHPWTVAACNFVLMMVAFTMMRLFFYRVNIDIYPDVSTRHLLEMLGGGIRFDLTALLYLNSVYLVLMLLPLPWSWRTNNKYQKAVRWFYWVPNILGIIANAVDTVYVRFSDRRTTMAFFSEFENDDNLSNIFFTSMVQYWYVSVFTIVLIIAVIWLTRRACACRECYTRLMPVYYVAESLILAVSVYFTIIGIRGGFGAFTRPITLSNALQYTDRPCETNVVLNTPFALMRSSEGKAYRNPHYFADDELEAIYTPVHPANQASLIENRESKIDKNVVVFILESFSKENIGFYNHDLDEGTYTGYTPFLDSLLEHSVTYSLSLSSGRKSIDAMPSILAGIPRFGSPYILTPYSTNDVMSIASCLNTKGYETAFFHGAPNGSMGFMAFARSCGFKAYYGKDEYNNDSDYDGYWGIWDEEFLQFYARTMSTMQEPFMTAVFTVTSHHPFQVPARYEDTFPRGTQPIHRCIGYTDYALRRFFDYAKTQPWYTNTLFVFTADHTNSLTHAEYTNDKGVYEVPVIFYDPSWQRSTADLRTDIPVCQADIMSSVLGYVGYDEPFVAFGEDILTQRPEHKYVVNYNDPLYQCFSDSLLVQYDGQHIVHIYNFRQDRLLQHDELDILSDSEEVQDMLRYMQAYIQQYIARMMENRLVIRD